ncbi:Ketosteroid isomerase-related protein [Actinopolymorpha cephalotaxi]|uniref:Ketosteroid isomerase-like protein n=1 Tax=Actinopolymorpha cephalotaxi TaxID=504797 RepID=A0A1I2Z3R2_9ACTN|nr:nuclear transport factor 2 family protein [Actinopolymorpha cephalotaxi]NYH81839.1 ketosteroid isomerase-like protein [Actinopolymorpha cephalotaxi]SFH32350.1 Ketosteroid isomerase-related protein [Actinopolymorpha cephalotaxi]
MSSTTPNPNPSPREVFLRLVHGVADGRFEELADLYAEKTDVRHAMATPEVSPLTSRSSLRAHFTVPPDTAVSIPRRRVVDVVVHETTDPEVIVAEFGYEFFRPDGPVTKVPCVFVLRVRDGEIVESRDYIDPIRSAQAADEVDALIATLQP